MVGSSHTAASNGYSGYRYSTRRHCPPSANRTRTLFAVFLCPLNMSPLPSCFFPSLKNPLPSFPLGCGSVEGCVGNLPDIHCLVLAPKAKVGHLNLRPGFQSTPSSVRTWVRCLTSQTLSPILRWRQHAHLVLLSTVDTNNGSHTVGARELASMWNDRRPDPWARLPPPSAPG